MEQGDKEMGTGKVGLDLILMDKELLLGDLKITSSLEYQYHDLVTFMLCKQNMAPNTNIYTPDPR